ncbi:MAG TPA: hypothetical protein VIC24_12645 [Gemmatimonadaceae bacterium]
MLLAVIVAAAFAPLIGGCPSSVRNADVAERSALGSAFALSPRLVLASAASNAFAEARAGGPDDADAACAAADTTRSSGRPRAITYSDAYYTRLTIHRIGSYAMLPLFLTEYILGQKLINDSTPSSGLKTAHGIVATGIVTVFAANTVTGVWNWLDSRHDPSDHTLRNVHSVIMLASDVGFLWTATSTPGGIRHTPPNVRRQQARRHRAIAITSISVSTVGAAMMWFFKH